MYQNPEDSEEDIEHVEKAYTIAEKRAKDIDSTTVISKAQT